MHGGALDALATGVLAGLALVLPPGAVSALLIDAGLREGRRAALPAALGIATIDFLYALVAVLAGAAVAGPLVREAGLIRWVSAGALVAFAAWRLAHLRAPLDAAAGPPNARRSYLRFLLLTAVNPLTVTYFAAVVAGLPWLASRPDSALITFALGTFAASASWHLGLALASTGLALRLTPQVVRGAAILGQLGIVVLAVTIAL
jgi:threonine/homoserine/homoserine lactone efflux protein